MILKDNGRYLAETVFWFWQSKAEELYEYNEMCYISEMFENFLWDGYYEQS